MKYLVDTDYVISHLLGRPDATTLLDTLAKDGFAISLVTVGEVYDGIYYGRDPKRGERQFRQFLEKVDILPVNQTIMKEFARIRGGLRRQGLLISDFDILIGATALYHNLTVVTRNFKDYRRIPQLSLYHLENLKSA